MSRFHEDDFYDPYDDDFVDEYDPEDGFPIAKPASSNKKTKKKAESKTPLPAKSKEPPAKEPPLQETPEQSSHLNTRPKSDFVQDAELTEFCAEEPRDRRPTLHLVIIGHVDAGKSTLMGRLLHDLGYIDQKTVHKNTKEASQAGKASFSWAWILDERPEERSRGVTIDVATTRFETKKFNVVLLDAPGHKDFVPNMISGATQADAAILAVDGSINGFEAGFQVGGSGFRSSGEGQTREHLQLARSLGIEQVAVVITKLDTCQYSKNRFEEIKKQLESFMIQCGFKSRSIQWLICSAPQGINVVERPSEEELGWFSGPTVLEAIDNFRPVQHEWNAPFRFPIADGTKSRSLGSSAASGKIESGAIKIGSTICVMPYGIQSLVKAIEIDGKARKMAVAGESCDIGLSGVGEEYPLLPGCVICSDGWPCRLSSRLLCKLVIMDSPMPIIPGLQVSLQAHTARVPAKISGIQSIIDAKTGEIKKERPRCITQNQTAIVEISTESPICIEVYSDFKPLGRLTLRESGRTLAAGIVTSIF